MSRPAAPGPDLLIGRSVTTAPAADQEAHGEHARQGEGPSDSRDAVGDCHAVGDEDQVQQRGRGRENGDREVGGFFEGTATMADGVGTDEAADEQMRDNGGQREGQSGIHEHRGVLEVEPQPGGAIDGDEPDHRIEQQPHPPMNVGPTKMDGAENPDSRCAGVIVVRFRSRAMYPGSKQLLGGLRTQKLCVESAIGVEGADGTVVVGNSP